MYLRNRKYKAGIALITVITFMTIALLVGFALSISSVNYKTSIVSFEKSSSISYTKISCMEEILLKLTSDSSFRGNGNMTINNGACSYTVSSHTNPSYVNINLSVNMDNYYSASTALVDITQSPLVVEY